MEIDYKFKFLGIEEILARLPEKFPKTLPTFTFPQVVVKVIDFQAMPSAGSPAFGGISGPQAWFGAEKGLFKVKVGKSKKLLDNFRGDMLLSIE
jgi:hypothetical protein